MVMAANPMRTNSANWSAVKPCMRMTYSGQPPEPQPASSASAHLAATRRDFLKQLEPFAGNVEFEMREPGSHAAGPRKARHDPKLNRGRHLNEGRSGSCWSPLQVEDGRPVGSRTDEVIE
jgi:hypothetical protein